MCINPLRISGYQREKMSLDTIYWEITGACNLKCEHCHLGCPSKRSILSKPAALERVETLAKNGVETLLLTGGEPLLNPYLYNIIERAKTHNMDVALLTNGTLIDRTTAERLAKANPTTVQISIDGLHELHDHIRGRGTFNRIEQAIDNLKAADILPLMKLTITSSNIDSIDDVITYCRSQNLRLNLSLAQEIGSVENNGIMPSPQEYFRVFIHLYKRKRKEKLQLTLPDFSIEEFLDTGHPKSGCSAGSRMATITKDDYLLPCVFMSGLGLSTRDGIQPFSEDALRCPGDVFTLLKKHGTEEFGCPLRKFKYGKDIYSVYEFARFMKHENL